MSQRTSPPWYKDAIIYQLHVRAYHDSLNDGIGDFAGLTQKLDYLEDLGVTALWLLPFCPSPLRDDGYDISDYTNIHPNYGTLKDFQRFLKEAHRRGLRVITELVLNHTSDQHEWFQKSRRAEPGSRWRNYYVWSDDPTRYKNARIIFKDFETSNWTWDPVAKAYFWHRFYSHQPDLNWENPEVKQAMFDAMDFWFDMGVDGLRLDAVPYLYEREGTNCENLPETHQALRELRQHVDTKYKDRMLLAEANQWPEDSVAYFGDGDECHMAFHFPVMPRMFMALRMEDRHPVTEILRITPPIPETSQWAMFLRNHDELTLEMVTDEERDYMWRSYARDRAMRINLGIRRRLAPLLENDRRRIELMNALLFSLPGTPIIYYGDEIGMGDNVYLGDRHGVRTPMQWSSDRNAGFSRANPQKLYLPVNIDPEYHYEAVNVEAQRNNPHSLLWWMKRLIAQRKQFCAFGNGSLEFLYPGNRKILAFIREYDGERILVIANLSRFSQSADIDLSKYDGYVPIELFGASRFRPITREPYFISMAPHSFYWLSLQSKESLQENIAVGAPAQNVPVLIVKSAEEIFSRDGAASLRRALPKILRSRPEFLGRNRSVRQATIDEVIPITSRSSILIVYVEYTDGDPETYVLPMAIASGEEGERLATAHSQALLARWETGGGERGVLYSAMHDADFARTLLGAILKRKSFAAEKGTLIVGRTNDFRKVWERKDALVEPRPHMTDPTRITFDPHFMLKIYPLVEPGHNPDREMQFFLNTKTGFEHTPRILGWLDYERKTGDGVELIHIGVLSSHPGNASNGWAYLRDHLGLFFEKALTIHADDPRLTDMEKLPMQLFRNDPTPSLVGELMGTDVDAARLLGVRTAEMHMAMASHPEIHDFAPEPFTDFYRNGLYHGMVGKLSRTLDRLRQRVSSLPPNVREKAEEILDGEADLRAIYKPVRDDRAECERIRNHGDFHLGQVLFTGKDVMVTNFDGDRSRPMSERRIKRAALQDVASMIRSFQYIAYGVLFGQVPGIVPVRDAQERLERWARAWSAWMSALFLGSYLRTANGAKFIPQNDQSVMAMLRAYLIDKSLVEINYELDYRPDWLIIPLQGLMEHLHWIEDHKS